MGGSIKPNIGGGANVSFFMTVKWAVDLPGNVRIETRLRQALQKEKPRASLSKPKVDLITERCVGMEALLRWNDEETMI